MKLTLLIGAEVGEIVRWPWRIAKVSEPLVRAKAGNPPPWLVPREKSEQRIRDVLMLNSVDIQ